MTDFCQNRLGLYFEFDLMQFHGINQIKISVKFSNKISGKEAYKKINSKDKIFNHFNNDKKGLEFISGDERFKETIYATQDQLLTALTDETKNNWSMPIEDDRRYLLINEDHVMTIRLKKQDDCMKVIYYDPNKTAQHTTFFISNPEQMTPACRGLILLKMSFCVSCQWRAWYALQLHGATVREVL